MKWNENGDWKIALLEGEIDHHAARAAREQIDGAVARNHIRKLALDFGGVSFMDSSGIGLIMGRYRVMKEIGGELRVIHSSPQTEKLMRLAGLSLLNVIEQKEGTNHDGNQ